MYFNFSAFNTASEEQLDFYELHICVRDYCFAREDRLVGVAVLQLKDIVDQVWNTFYTTILWSGVLEYPAYPTLVLLRHLS